MGEIVIYYLRDRGRVGGVCGELPISRVNETEGASGLFFYCTAVPSTDVVYSEIVRESEND